MFSESRATSPKAGDQPGILSPSSVCVERLGAHLLGQDPVRWAGSAVPCCNTAGVEWRPSHPPQAGSACPRTLPFPPLTQLGRNSPKPRSRPESSLRVPLGGLIQPAVPVRGQCCPFQQHLETCWPQANENFPKSRSHRPSPIPFFAQRRQSSRWTFPDSHSRNKAGPTCAPPPSQGKRSQTPEGGNAGRRRGLYLVPLTHDKVAPAHHEAAGAHVHVAPRLQQANVFLQERRNGSFDSGQHSLVTHRHPVPEEGLGL